MKTPVIHIALCLAIICGVSACSKPKKTNLLRKPQTTSSSDTNAADAPIAIKLKWNPDERYVVREEAVLNLDTTLPGSNAPSKMAIALKQDISISAGKKLPDGGQELDWQIIAQRFFYQPAEKAYLIFDDRQSAAEDDGDPGSPLMRKLMNVPVKCFTDADGKLVKTEGLDALAAKFENGNTNSKTGSRIRAAIQAIVTEKNLQELFHNLAAWQPADPVKIGQTWPAQLQWDTPGAPGVAVNARCTLADWDRQENRDCLRIEFKGEVSAKPGPSDVAGTTKVEAGTITGTAWYDPELGTLLNASMEAHFTAGTLVSGVTIPSSVKLTSNLRLLSVEEK